MEPRRGTERRRAPGRAITPSFGATCRSPWNKPSPKWGPTRSRSASQAISTICLSLRPDGPSRPPRASSPLPSGRPRNSSGKWRGKPDVREPLRSLRRAGRPALPDGRRRRPHPSNGAKDHAFTRSGARRPQAEHGQELPWGTRRAGRPLQARGRLCRHAVPAPGHARPRGLRLAGAHRKLLPPYRPPLAFRRGTPMRGNNATGSRNGTGWALYPVRHRRAHTFYTTQRSKA